ncbi:MAG: hypothetical protein AB7P99_02630 [Vicinamibacterales bacterium]
MRRLRTLTIGLGLAGLLVAPAAAQQTAPPEGGRSATQPHRMGAPGMMMAACEDHTKLKTDVADGLARVRQARTAGNPATATAALADAERALAAVQAHFSTCEAGMDAMKEKMKDKTKGTATAPKADDHKH